MKKLFISCPMNGRTEGDIKKTFEKMHAIAEFIFDQKLEVIPTYIENNSPKTTNQAIWYLGESIKKMAGADYFIGIKDYYGRFKGCCIENEVAKKYGVETHLIDIKRFTPNELKTMLNIYIPTCDLDE